MEDTIMHQFVRDVMAASGCIVDGVQVTSGRADLLQRVQQSKVVIVLY